MTEQQVNKLGSMLRSMDNCFSDVGQMVLAARECFYE